MARRQQNSSSKILWSVIAMFIVATALASLLFKDEAFGDVPQLAVKDYSANAKSLRGNSYRVKGEVVDSLAWSPENGRLISVRVDKEGLLPVLIANKFGNLNIQKQQKFIFLVEVDEQGILRTKEIRKP